MKWSDNIMEEKIDVEIKVEDIIYEVEKEEDEYGISVADAIKNSDLIIMTQYIPFSYKQIMVDDIKKSCLITDENGITKIDFGLKILVTEYLIVLQYTNINLPEINYVDTYDQLKENGIVSKVLELIPLEEFNMLIDMINDEIDQEVKLANQLEVIVSKFLGDLLSKIPETKNIDKWVKQFVNTIKNFDGEKYKKLQELMNYSKTDTTK
jgi:hypothetical protein